MGRYLLNILIAFDRTINAAIGGDPWETLSSVAYRNNRDGSKWGFLMGVINTLFFNKEHCLNAYRDDRSHTLKP